MSEHDHSPTAAAAGAAHPSVPEHTSSDDTSDPSSADDSVAAILRRERDDYYERWLRTTAEFDNFRKRIERDRKDLADFAAADLLREVLPVVDDLERALHAPAGHSVEAYRKGVELIQKQILDLLKKRGVSAIEAVGHDFDPHMHQAVTREISDRYRDGEVIEELQRGYLLGERLLRPTMVKVATRE